jgi:hypothetical protein
VTTVAITATVAGATAAANTDVSKLASSRDLLRSFPPSSASATEKLRTGNRNVAPSARCVTECTTSHARRASAGNAANANATTAAATANSCRFCSSAAGSAASAETHVEGDALGSGTCAGAARAGRTAPPRPRAPDFDEGGWRGRRSATRFGEPRPTVPGHPPPPPPPPPRASDARAAANAPPRARVPAAEGARNAEDGRLREGEHRRTRGGRVPDASNLTTMAFTRPPFVTI